MSYYKQLLIFLLVVQMLASCWARYRYEPGRVSAAANWNDVDDLDSNENHKSNIINESDLLNKFLPITFKEKKAIRHGHHYNNEERRKKFLTESTNFQGGHSLQGLWMMPGRR